MTDTYIEQYAANARAMARQVLAWRLDSLRISAGLVEVVSEPHDDFNRPLRRRLRREQESPRPTGTRLMLCDRSCVAFAHFHFVRDVARP